MGNAGFTAMNGVNQGDGSAGNPYVVDGWDITANCGGDTIGIAETTAYFVVRNLNLTPYGSGCSSGGIAILNATNGIVENVNLAGGFAQGISLSGVHSLSLRANTIGSGGIAAQLSDNVTLSDNSVTGSGGSYAVWLWYGQDVEVSGNYVTGTGTSLGGIYAGNTQRLGIVNNILANNWRAIFLESASDIVIQGNDISKSGYLALVLESAGNVRLVENNLSHGNGPIISSGTWSGLTVLHNNIYGDLFDGSPSDRFDGGYPSGGNFWSGYEGSDECSGQDQTLCGRSDGFADRPRSLGGAVDHYPLMVPWRLPFGLNASVSPMWCVSPCPVRFGARVLGGVLPLTYRWTFGDGDTSALAQSDHVYRFAGTFPAHVSIEDAAGRRADEGILVTVESAGPSSVIILPPFVVYSGFAVIGATVVVSVTLYYTRIRQRPPPEPGESSPRRRS